LHTAIGSWEQNDTLGSLQTAVCSRLERNHPDCIYIEEVTFMVKQKIRVDLTSTVGIKSVWHLHNRFLPVIPVG